MNFLSLHCRGVGDDSKIRWIKELCKKHSIKFLALQETKVSNLSLFQIRSIWGDGDYDFAESKPMGKAGGIISIWDKRFFSKERIVCDEGFVAFFGSWIPSVTGCCVINVYAPQDLTKKKNLWYVLFGLINRWEGVVIIMGDFNAIRDASEKSVLLLTGRLLDLLTSSSSTPIYSTFQLLEEKSRGATRMDLN